MKSSASEPGLSYILTAHDKACTEADHLSELSKTLTAHFFFSTKSFSSMTMHVYMYSDLPRAS